MNIKTNRVTTKRTRNDYLKRCEREINELNEYRKRVNQRQTNNNNESNIPPEIEENDDIKINEKDSRISKIDNARNRNERFYFLNNKYNKSLKTNSIKERNKIKFERLFWDNAIKMNEKKRKNKGKRYRKRYVQKAFTQRSRSNNTENGKRLKSIKSNDNENIDEHGLPLYNGPDSQQDEIKDDSTDSLLFIENPSFDAFGMDEQNESMDVDDQNIIYNDSFTNSSDDDYNHNHNNKYDRNHNKKRGNTEDSINHERIGVSIISKHRNDETSNDNDTALDDISNTNAVITNGDNYNDQEALMTSDNGDDYEPQDTMDEIVYGMDARQAFNYLNRLRFEEEMELILNNRTEMVKSFLFRNGVHYKYDAHSLYNFERIRYETNIGQIYRYINSKEGDHIARIALCEHFIRFIAKKLNNHLRSLRFQYRILMAIEIWRLSEFRNEEQFDFIWDQLNESNFENNPTIYQYNLHEFYVDHVNLPKMVKIFISGNTSNYIGTREWNKKFITVLIKIDEELFVFRGQITTSSVNEELL